MLSHALSCGRVCSEPEAELAIEVKLEHMNFFCNFKEIAISKFDSHNLMWDLHFIGHLYCSSFKELLSSHS